MNNILKLVLIILCQNLFGQTNLHNKKPNTFLGFNQIESYYMGMDKNNIEADFQLYTSTFGYLLLVECTGQIRSISSKKMMWLNSSFKALNFDVKADEIFQKEVLVKIGNEQFWFPIQETLSKYWRQELKTHNKVLIYIRAYGSKKTIKEDKWLITINSFNSEFYDGLWQEALNSFDNNDPENGIRCVKKLMELNPNDGRNYSMLGYYYYDIGYPSNIELLKKADSLYSKAIILTPEYSYVYYQKALVKIQLSEFSEAWDNIEKARKLGEENIEQEKLAELESNLPHAKYLKTKN